MGITNEYLSTIHNFFKFNDQVLKIINTCKIKQLENKPKQKKEIIKIFSKIKKHLHPPISNDTIQLFYENPKEFFSSYEKLLENTSFYDDGGNSIFIHYFYVIHDLYYDKSAKINDSIYEKNFTGFFRNEAKYLSIQDFSLETPLHKLAKLRNKNFFLNICKKLKDINVLSEELLLINNINGESCYDYIFKEIKENKNKIIKNNFNLYQQFLDYFPNIIKSRSTEEQKFIILFSCLISFDEQKWNEVNFNIAIESIYNLEDKNGIIFNIFQFLYYPNDSGMNYFNCLFHICKDNSDFDKLFKLTSDISKINTNNKLFEKLCISDHISYVLRKINSKKIKGEMEINYAIKLVKKVIPLLIKGESDENIINIISVRTKIYKEKTMNFNNKGICNNLINNPNLSFEQKFEILTMIKEILKYNFDEVVDTDFLYLYKLFDAFNKKEITETNIYSKYKDNIFVQKIFADFYYIGELFRKVYKTWKDFQQMNIEDYISELKEFINNNYLDIFGIYKIRYNLPIDKIQIIVKLIIAYEQQNYSNDIENKFISEYFKCGCYKKNNISGKLFRKFMETKPKLTNILLSMLDKDCNKNDFITTFFSFKYDYEIIFKDEKIINYFKKSYFEGNRIKEKLFQVNDKFNKLFKQALLLAKNKSYEFAFCQFILKYFPLKKVFKAIISEFNILMKRFLNKLIYNWEEEIDFSKLIKFINDNMLIFCFLFSTSNENEENEKNKIIFFFDEFIKILEPNIRDKFILYKKLAFEYIDYKEKSANFFNLDQKYYLSLWLIFIRLKFGKYNPQVLIIFFSYYGSIYQIFLSFLKSYFSTESKNDILHHFLFSEYDLTSKEEAKLKIQNINFSSFKNSSKYKILSKYISLFVSKYIYKLAKNENSLIFDYITKILEYRIKCNEDWNNKLKSVEDLNSSEREKKEEPLFKFGIEIESYKRTGIHKSFIFGINKNQNENIYNLTKELFLYSDDNYFGIFSYLELEPREFNKEKILHYINILKQISIDLKEKTQSIKDCDINNYLWKEKVNDNTLMNLYKFLYVLKDEKDSLLNCVKNNKFLVFYSFFFLLKHIYLCINKEYKEKYNNSSSIDEQYNLIFEEIVNFMNFYNKEKDYYANNDKFSLSKCLLFIFYDDNYNSVVRKLNVDIKKIRSKIFSNYNNNYLLDLFKLLNRDIFAFASCALHLYYYCFNGNKNDNSRVLISNEANNIILFIFDEFLFYINPDLRHKYKPFKSLYNDLFSIELNSNKDKEPFSNIIGDQNLNIAFYSTDYERTSLIAIYIYIKQLNRLNNPNILLSILSGNKKTFFKIFINCLSESKKELNGEKHLFVAEEELIDFGYIKEKYKSYEFGANYIHKKINKFITKYLIDLNYLENSFVYKYIADNLDPEYLEKNKQYLSFVIFNYYPSEEKNVNSNKSLLQNKLLNLFSNNFSFYGFLNEDYNSNIDNEERIIKKIKLIENLIEYSSNSNNKINMIKEEYCENYLKKDNFFNLYAFLKNLKLQNKRLFYFAKNNSYFIKETVKILANVYNLMKNSLVQYYFHDSKINEINEFLYKQIIEFFKDLLNNEVNKKFLLQCEINGYFKIYNLLTQLALDYNKSFENNINKNDSIDKYNQFKNIMSFIFTQIKEIKEMLKEKNKFYRYKIKREIKLYDFYKTINKLFQNNFNEFCGFLKIILNFFNTSSKGEITKLITSIMKNNIEKFFNCFEQLKTTISDSISFEIENELDTIKTIEFILNNIDNQIYKKIKLINNSHIYNNLQKSFILLGRINNQQASIFIYEKFEKSWNNMKKTQKFIEFIKNTINNNFVFDYLLNSLSFNELEEIFLINKDYQKIIISSLFRYSTINGYYITKTILNNLFKYLPKNEFQSIIYSPLNEPIISSDEYELEDVFIEQGKFDLLSFALSIKYIKNYETIAVILSFCKFPQGLIKLFDFLDIGVNLNFSNFRSFCFFSGISNKEKIKDLEINFYNLIILAESIISSYNILETFSDIEKFMFNNIIKIFIMDITPRELMILTDVDLPESRMRNVRNDEIKIFVLLALFEIKGLPIFPIKKYFPSFYLKIETFFNKFKSLIKITPICFKQNADVKLYEKLKLLIEEKNCNYIIENFPLFNNLLAIFLLEGKDSHFPNLSFEKMTSIYKSIIDLIIDNNIVPFYDDNKEEEFFSSIYSINDVQKFDFNSIKILINSLVDFHQTSNIIIRKDKEKSVSFKWKNKFSEFKVYVSYLEAISNICRYVILISDENKNYYNVNYFTENLSEESYKRIIALKNSINLEKIILFILLQFETNYSGNEEFMISFKNRINNYLKNNPLINDLCKDEIMNILSYFKYLNLSCFALLKFINQLNELNDIKMCINYLNIEKPKNINFIYIQNNNKEIAEKGIRQSLYQLGTEILDVIRNETELFEEENFNLKYHIKSDITIYYYFNEEREEFVECYTDINLLKFIYEKSDSILKFIDRKNIKDILFLKENLSDETINSIFSEIILSLNYEFDKTQKDGIFETFQSFIKQNNNYICKYLEETAFNLNQPNYDYFKFLMFDKIRQIIFNYMYPFIKFNKSLYDYCQNNYFHNYVDFSELISSINKTKFHPKDYLNSAFQIKAINYLIYDKSNLYLFLFELYDKIRKKSIKRHKFEIKESFKIKVVQGKKSNFELVKSRKKNSDNSDTNSIISNRNLNNKKKKYKLKVVDFINSKNKMYFSIVSKNHKKRFPNIHWSQISSPLKEKYYGRGIDVINKIIFQKRLSIYSKSAFLNEQLPKVPLKPYKERNNIKYINVFDYIFIIKSVDNEKIIKVVQNDISEIIKAFSDEDSFISMLNKNGYIEKKYDLNYDLDDIEINYKFN